MLCSLALMAAACGGKAPPPKSTTTTRTQTTTEQDSGETTTSEVKEIKIQQSDGSQDVERTTTTKQSIPSPTPE